MEELDPYVIADILERTGNFPSYARVSTTFSKASDILMQDLVSRMNREYPLWDIQMQADIFYLLFAKAIYSNDYIAAKLILKQFIKGSMQDNWAPITHVMGILYIQNRELFNSLLSIFPQGYANKLLALKGRFGEYIPGRYRPIDYGTFPSQGHIQKYNRKPIQLSRLSMPYLIYKYPNMWNENLKNIDLGSESISTAIKLAIIMALHDQGQDLPIPNNM